jgi:hypothetical protein
MGEYGSHIAIAKITDPTAVEARCSALGQTAHDGAIFCEIPELGYLGQNLQYCRYGLSIPYLRPQVGWKLWVEPTIGETERWKFTGFADCSGDDDADPATTDQFLLPLAAGKFKIKLGTDVFIELNGTAKTAKLQVASDVKAEFDGSAKTLKATCGQSTVEMSNTSVKINGTNHEVLV